MTKARAALIVDDRPQPKRIADLLKMSRDSDVYEITHLIVQKTSRKDRPSRLGNVFDRIRKLGPIRFLALLGFDAICAIEKAVLKRTRRLRNAFDEFDIESFGIPIVDVHPEFSRNGSHYSYSSDDLKKIREMNFDILVRGGRGLPSGEVLKVCPMGILSCHFANSDLNPGAPPGFWEVLKRQRSTGFAILLLGDEPDGGNVVVRGRIATSFMYMLNLSNLHSKSTVFIHRTLERVLSGKKAIEFIPKRPYDRPVYTIPGLGAQVAYLLKTGIYVARKVFQKAAGMSNRWNVAYQYTENWRQVALANSRVINNPPNRFLADPFVIKRSGKHYCFVEDYCYSARRARISVFEITEQGDREIGVALEEDCHLSYPYLFEDGDELYMCPETHEKGDIRIYRCVDFPTGWELAKVLMTDVSAADTSIFQHDGKWWLLTNIDTSMYGDHCSELHLFSSDRLLSDDWKPHPMNPIVFDSERGRNGGLLFEGQDIFRVYQKQGWHMYGEGFGVARIVRLSETQYVEAGEFEVSAEFFDRALGAHTYSFAEGLVAFDFVSLERTRT